MQSEFLEVKMADLYGFANQHMIRICGLDRQGAKIEKLKLKMQLAWEQHFENRSMIILVADFDKKCVREDRFQFENESINCGVLSRIGKDTVLEGYLFLFHAPEVDFNQVKTFIDKYYIDCWQTAIVDAGRDWLSDYLADKKTTQFGEKVYLSDTFGPGYYGMQMEDIKVYFNILEFERLKMKLHESGMMEPLKSVVGAGLILNKMYDFNLKGCVNCMAKNKHCEMCRNYIEK